MVIVWYEGQQVRSVWIWRLNECLMRTKEVASRLSSSFICFATAHKSLQSSCGIFRTPADSKALSVLSLDL